MVKTWYADFKRSRTDTDYAKRPRCSNSVFVPENKKTKKIDKFLLADCKLNLREISEKLKISEGSVFAILHEICQWESCDEYGYPFAHSRSKTTTYQRFRGLFATILNATKRSFCVNIWEWRKHESTSSLHNQISSYLCGQQQAKIFQMIQRRKHGLARFDHRVFGWTRYFVHRLP